jgi:hypothetical protein
MRRLSVIVAALLVAGCQVDVEGAPCDAPGERNQCPSSQACGLDAKCSTRAAACADMCTPGEKRCTEDARIATITVCDTTRDPICGSWEQPEACAAGLVCAGDAPACACPAVTDGSYHFDRDPAAVAIAEVAPTGAASPSACRLDGIEEALAKAAEFGPGGRAVFAGDAFAHAITSPPFAIPAGVTLTTTAPGDPSRAVLTIASLGSASSPAVVLQPGAALEGFTIRNGGATTGAGIAFACDGTAGAALRAVRVEARQPGVTPPASAMRLAIGVELTETCGAELEDVIVSGASGAGLSVDVGSGATPTTVVDSTFEGNGTGIVLRSGTLSIDGSQIEANVRRGFWAKRRDGAGPYPVVALAIEDTSFIANGDTGLKLEDLPDDSTVALSRIEITANHATTADSTHALGRLAGGLVLQGKRPVSFALKGSRIYGNDADQVGMWASPAWDLSGTATPPADACAAPNVFACPAADAYLVYSSTLNAPAFHNVWDPNPPGSVVVNVDYASNCPDPVPSLLPACAP